MINFHSVMLICSLSNPNISRELISTYSETLGKKPTLERLLKSAKHDLTLEYDFTLCIFLGILYILTLLMHSSAEYFTNV